MVNSFGSPPANQRFLGNFNNIWTRHWTGPALVAGNTGFAAYQCGFAVAPCPDFNQVRFLFKNIEATPPSVSKMIVAVTGSSLDRITPSVGSGKTNDPATGWVDVTFSGSTSSALPAFTSGDVRVPATMWSDWITLPSVPPSDGLSTKPYIMWRSKMSAAFTYWGQGTTRTQLSRPETFFDQYVSFATDPIATPTNATAANTTLYSDASPIFAIEFRSSQRVAKVLCIGDSITQGVGDNSAGNSMGSWVPKCEALCRASSIPMNFINYGQGGAPTVSYLAFGKQAVTDHLPTIAMYSVFSPNDSIPTAANTLTAYNRAMDFANHCFANNTLPIFTFLAPNDGYVTNADVYRRILRDRIKDTGIMCIDLTPAVGNGGAPERFLAGLKNDNTHPNAAGYLAMANLNISLLTPLLQANISY